MEFNLGTFFGRDRRGSEEVRLSVYDVESKLQHAGNHRANIHYFRHVDGVISLEPSPFRIPGSELEVSQINIAH
jgi:hypothetical protein